MVSASFCGLWAIVSSSNPKYLGATLLVDYDSFRFTQYIKKYGILSLRKNIYGTVYLSDESKGKVVWSKKIEYGVETKILPTISLPWKTRCPRFNIDYNLDVTKNELTVVKSKETYIFRKSYVSLENNDHFFKIFCTQLLFDLLIRHLHLP
jgi:hypothetical protein